MTTCGTRLMLAARRGEKGGKVLEIYLSEHLVELTTRNGNPVVVQDSCHSCSFVGDAEANATTSPFRLTT